MRFLKPPRLPLLLALLIVPFTRSLSELVTSSNNRIRILALFSGTTNDLGLDHRLGRQVLKLALNKSKLLHPELDVELIIHNDDTDCSNLNTIPTKVAEQFYLSHDQFSKCKSQTGDSSRVGSICNFIQDLDAQELEKFLNLSAASTKSKRFIHSQDLAWRQKFEAIIGPSCDFLVDLVARMAAYWRTPVYSVTSINAMFSQKENYPTLTRLSPSIDHLSMFLIRLFEKFNWHHLAIIQDTSQIENEIIRENLDKTINRMRFSWLIERKLFALNEDVAHGSAAINETKTTRLDGNQLEQLPLYSNCNEELQAALLGARKVARIFLLLINDSTMIRRLLLCAYELKMNNGEFVFLAINLGLKSSQGTESLGDNLSSLSNTKNSKSHNQRVTQNYDWFSSEDEKNNLLAKQMFESMMIFSVELPISDEYNLFVEQTLDLAHQEYPDVRFDRSSVSGIAVALHDSLLLAVEAQVRASQANKTIATNNSTDDGTFSYQKDQMAATMWNQHYADGLIPNMHINSQGDQELDYVLSDMEPEMGLMRPVASYSKETRQIQFLPNVYIHWPIRQISKSFLGKDGLAQSSTQNDLPPPDEPECGFNDDAERCIDRQSLYAFLFLIVVLFLSILSSVLFSRYQYKKIKYQQQLDDFWWKIKWEDLQFIQTTDSLASNSPGSVARALRAGASVVSCGASDVGSMVSVNPVKTKKHSLIERKSSQSKQGPVPVIVTTSEQGSIVKGAKPDASKQDTSDRVSVASGGQTKMSSVVQGGSCIIKSSVFSSVIRTSMLAMYNNELVIVKMLNGRQLNITKDLLIELRLMREHMNDNLAKFIGLCVEPRHLSIMYEFCSRGSLQDMLLNTAIAMDWTLKCSIIGDIVNGLNFIHTTLLDYHGRLKSTNLVLDSRFTVKITDFGLQNLYSQLDVIKSNDSEAGDELESEGDDEGKSNRLDGKQHDQLSVSHQSVYNMESVSMIGSKQLTGSRRSRHSASKHTDRLENMKNKGAARYFWTAPEHLRDQNIHFAGSKKGDVYSLAIILFEIFTRKEPYHYGTNAKPHWPTIKKDKLNRLADQHQHGGTGSSLIGDRRGTNINSAISLTSKRVARRVKLAKKNSVAPSSVITAAISQGGTEIGASIVEETGSVVSCGKRSTLSEGEDVAAEPGLRSVRLSSITAIDENQPDNQDDSSTVIRAAANQQQRSTCSTTIKDTASQEANQKIDAEEILDQLQMGIQPEPVRPYLPNYVIQNIVQPKLIELMRSCWSEAPSRRPTMQQVRVNLRKITKGLTAKNYLDNLLERLQNYAADLERIVDGKSGDILEEKNRTEELLYQLVPKFVADRLKRNEPIIPQVFDGVTIFFSDIIGFEKYASVMSPSDLVDLLNSIYSSFESIISSFDVTKIETITDQYLIASGISLQHEQVPSGRLAIEDSPTQGSSAIPELTEQTQTDSERAKRSFKMKIKALKKSKGDSMGDEEGVEKKMEGQDSMDQQAGAPQGRKPPGLDLNHYKRSSAEQVARMALCIRDLMKSFHFRPSSKDQQQQQQQTAPLIANFNIRIGIHSGRVCAGIVGVKRPKFCLIGDTVNVASRMHTNSKANRIQISDDTKQLLELVPGFSIEPRGKIEVKGKGLMETYWLESSY